ncbi:MAG: bifunctional methylenetetrahydrofolate dehydrogenase/methenyltetrahydrofolate cyclohydrolase FolD [Planctomycetes bacterium]|nr:bifunctional methylenetetrahydrofolate dehydrogenase/methenyltetrahydrofolate cyclohydrolase FolD [Planctomycetota bacterium]
MTVSRILDGKAIAKTVRAEVSARVRALRARGITPGLTVVLVGDDPASQVYVRNKDKAAAEAGFAARTLRLPATTRQAELLDLIDALNRDPGVHGVLLQLPLPKGLDAEAVLERLDPAKDVDGLTPRNVAALWRGEDALVPCTPAGCIELLDRHGIAIEGKRAVVIGRSQLVGKPLAALLLARNATVTIAHSRSRDLAGVAREAEILVAAVGRAKLVKASWVRPGAVVLDVGINRQEDGRLCGDVDFHDVLPVVGAITPVPGGVGPMTIAMLLANTVRAAARSAGIDPSALGSA